MVVYWILFPWNLTPASLCKPGLCRRGNQRYRFYFFRARYANLTTSYDISALSKKVLDLFEGIKEDWGGKPFVDLMNGWKYVLENYPQVTCIRTLFPDMLLTVSARSTLTARSLLARATEGTLSSRLHPHPPKSVLTTHLPQLDSRKP